jgi:hypothetical protein
LEECVWIVVVESEERGLRACDGVSGGGIVLEADAAVFGNDAGWQLYGKLRQTPIQMYKKLDRLEAWSLQKVP